MKRCVKKGQTLDLLETMSSLKETEKEKAEIS
jgi:hypothetical protein